MSASSWVFLKAHYAVLTAAREVVRKVTGKEAKDWKPILDQLPFDNPETACLFAEVRDAAPAQLTLAGVRFAGEDVPRAKRGWVSKQGARALHRLRRFLGVES